MYYTNHSCNSKESNNFFWFYVKFIHSVQIQNAVVETANPKNGHSSRDCTFLILHLASSYCHWIKPFWRCSSLSFSLALKYLDLFFGSPSLSDPESIVSRCWVAFIDILWFDVIPNLHARVGDFSANALKLLCMRAWSWKNKHDKYKFWRKSQTSLLGKLQATTSSLYFKLDKQQFED